MSSRQHRDQPPEVRRPVLVWIGLVLIGLVMLIAWGALALLHTDDLFDDHPTGQATVVIAVVAAGAVVMASLGTLFPRKADTRSVQLRPGARAAVASAVVAAWSLFLIGWTRYLEPLPWDAATVGIALLLSVVLGGALFVGPHWWSLVLLPAAAVGLTRISESFFDSGVELDQYHSALDRAFLLLPVTVVVGAVASHVRRSAVLGAVLLVVPVTAVAWAADRHARPIDRHPAVPLTIEVPSSPARPSYRGLAIADSKWRMTKLLGPAEAVVCATYCFGNDYSYGADTVTLSGTTQGVFNAGGGVTWNGVQRVEIRDPSAETAEGVGIGDNLAQFRRHYPGWCGLNNRQPVCEIDLKYAYIGFHGDPIDTIDLIASGTKGRG